MTFIKMIPNSKTAANHTSFALEFEIRRKLIKRLSKKNVEIVIRDQTMNKKKEEKSEVYYQDKTGQFKTKAALLEVKTVM